jgi:fructuronate reductase
VEIYELAKLRMLNGAHSALAYLGLERGHSLVHEAIEDQIIRAVVTRLMISEAGATLPSTFDVQQYAATLLTRFTNAALPHRLSQIAMDGSQKIPQRWLPVLAERQSAGRPSPATLAALAAWIRHVRGQQDVQDPLASELKSLWEVAGESGIVDTLFGSHGLFSNLWQASPENRRELRGLVGRERMPFFVDEFASSQR